MILDVHLVSFPQVNDARMRFEDRGIKTIPIYENAYLYFMHFTHAHFS